MNTHDDINKHDYTNPFEINANIKTKIKFGNNTYFAFSPHLGENVITKETWYQLPNVTRVQAIKTPDNYVIDKK